MILLRGFLLQLVDLQIFAALRVTLKPLVPTFPCFASIVVSLLEKVCKNKIYQFQKTYTPLSIFSSNFQCNKVTFSFRVLTCSMSVLILFGHLRLITISK